ncbi:MAG TPA: anti-CBASS Acb1 family protein, partial [Fimbriimonas sp.]|nr:anti-CBASS Acb1 family protein [Fimbriimonas sp.]
MGTPGTRLNSLTDLVDGVCGQGGPYQSQTIAQPYTLAEGNAYTPITLNRILLSYSYMTQGLIQTVIRQPVEDAFRGGVTVKTDELKPEELRLLNSTIKRSRKRDPNLRYLARKLNPNAAINLGLSDMRVVMDTLNWARLYGGAGLIINTDQNFATELDVEAIDHESPLEFIAADRWELILSQTNVYDIRNPTPFNFYGLPLHRSRVIKVSGVEAPSYIRLRLQGWGMSEIERCIRAINSFVKFENLIFELLDEAKIDVYQIQGFNDSLLTDDGTANTQRRIQLSNRLKNYQNALAMDKEDEYKQKQITWSGLAEIWNEVRMNLSSALKIPMNKLFGQSATGFGGGEDSLENYNSLVMGVREDAEPLVCEVVDLRCQQLFGFIPEYELEWRALKVLDGTAEEEVKTKKQARAIDLFQQRLVTGREVSQILRNDGLLHMETEVSKGQRDVDPMP